MILYQSMAMCQCFVGFEIFKVTSIFSNRIINVKFQVKQVSSHIDTKP